jgi:hypothetical protein
MQALHLRCINERRAKRRVEELVLYVVDQLAMCLFRQKVWVEKPKHWKKIAFWKPIVFEPHFFLYRVVLFHKTEIDNPLSNFTWNKRKSMSIGRYQERTTPKSFASVSTIQSLKRGSDSSCQQFWNAASGEQRIPFSQPFTIILVILLADITLYLHPSVSFHSFPRIVSPYVSKDYVSIALLMKWKRRLSILGACYTRCMLYYILYYILWHLKNGCYVSQSDRCHLEIGCYGSQSDRCHFEIGCYGSQWLTRKRCFSSCLWMSSSSRQYGAMKEKRIVSTVCDQL